MHRQTCFLLAALLLAPLFAIAQMPEGTPEKVEIEDLLRTPGMYDGKAVTVKGELRHGDSEDSSRQIFRLRGKMSVREIRVAQGGMGAQDLRFLEGSMVIITGVFWDLANQCYESAMAGIQCYDRRLQYYGVATEGFERDDKRYFLGASYVDREGDEPIPKLEEPKEDKSPDIDIPSGAGVDLRDLVKSPDVYLDKRIEVIGKFRGNNIYGDLSIRSKKTPRDFIIKVAEAAIWVTGKRPRGKGFELNPRMRRDTGKWLKVTGKPWMEDGMVYLKAEKLELEPKPEDPSLEPVEDEVAELEERKRNEPPPEVAFAVPLDGERDILLSNDFRIQFTNDMNLASFDRNVDLLYADDDGLSNPFPDMQIRYEKADRILVVLPGQTLEPSKEVILVLYNGIVDTNGKPLVVTAPDDEFPDAAAILRYFTGKR